MVELSITGAVRVHDGDLVGRAGVGALVVEQPVGHVVGEQAGEVDDPDAAGGVVGGEAGAHELVADLVGDAATGRAAPGDDDALVGPVGAGHRRPR